MKISLGILLFLTVCATVQMAYAPPKPAFEFTDHELQVSFDPDTLRFLALDTVSVRYHKNIDSIYFLLHDSLSVERIGIGHQTFNAEPVSVREVLKFLARSSFRNRRNLEHAQIVKVRIPTTLFAPKLEIHYSGIIDAQHQVRLWYPQTPCTPATISVTAMLPSRFRLTLPGQSIDECADDVWRICRRRVQEAQSDCTLQIELASETL